MPLVGTSVFVDPETVGSPGSAQLDAEVAGTADPFD
jgi:hypothetical protein